MSSESVFEFRKLIRDNAFFNTDNIQNENDLIRAVNDAFPKQSNHGKIIIAKQVIFPHGYPNEEEDAFKVAQHPETRGYQIEYRSGRANVYKTFRNKKTGRFISIVGDIKGRRRKPVSKRARMKRHINKKYRPKYGHTKKKDKMEKE